MAKLIPDANLDIRRSTERRKSGERKRDTEGTKERLQTLPESLKKRNIFNLCPRVCKLKLSGFPGILFSKGKLLTLLLKAAVFCYTSYSLNNLFQAPLNRINVSTTCGVEVFPLMVLLWQVIRRKHLDLSVKFKVLYKLSGAQLCMRLSVAVISLNEVRKLVLKLQDTLVELFLQFDGVFR